METLTVVLRPRGSFSSEITSDTLFGAVCWALADLRLEELDLESALEKFNAAPPFAFSSVFPLLAKDGNEVRFFPMPLIPPLRAEQLERVSAGFVARTRNAKQAKVDAVAQAKHLAKTAYASEKIFGQIVRGEVDAEKLFNRYRQPTGDHADDVESVGDALITTGERKLFSTDRRLEAFARATDVQHNQIDRVAGATVEGLLFYEHQMFLAPELARLWCLVRTDRREWIEAAFRYLADTGIGGGRTSGRGHFDIEARLGGTIPSAGDEANAFVTLSRYLPTGDEWNARGLLYYHLLNVRGKHESKFPAPLAGQKSPPIYKGLVRLMGEGSILALRERKEIFGRIVRVGELPDRKVYHSGLALAAFAKIEA